jgi:predicted nucleic acid-binding protein
MAIGSLPLEEASVSYLATASARVALIDSGPLLALFNGSDKWHARVVAWLQENEQIRLVTTWPVLTEVCALLARRIHNRAALDFLSWVDKGGVAVDAPDSWSLAKVLEISQRFADLPLDLADASIAETAARRGIGYVVSIDKDFDIYRDARGKYLVNLLLTP